jgi:hypothetical protein
MQTRPKESESNRAILWVLAAFFGAAVVWGASMWILKVNIRQAVFLIINDRIRLKALEPWVYSARQHPLSYEDAAAKPDQAMGKPVLWEMRIPAENPGLAFYRGDAAKPIRWTNPEKVHVAGGKGPDKRLFAVVGVIRRIGPDGVTLQFLGYE